VRTFASTGELNVTTTASVEGMRVVIVFAVGMEVHRDLFEHMLLARSAVDGGAAEVILVAPYLPYGRSERRYEQFGPIGLDAILCLLASSGIDHLVTVDLHSGRTHRIQGMPHVDVSATQLMRPLISKWRGRGTFLVAPDEGSAGRIRELSSELQLESVIFEKCRVGDSRVSLIPDGRPGDLPGDHAIVVDDALYTGATLRAVCRHLHAHGVGSVDLAVTHLMPSAHAGAVLAAAGIGRIAAANSIPAALQRRLDRRIVRFDLSESLAHAVASLPRRG
jgi:ribose-phosphate pyrophosphokinase